MRKKVNSKCYMCERRHPACQDKCPDYLAWKANLDATNAKIKDEKKKFEDTGMPVIRLVRNSPRAAPRRQRILPGRMR